MKVDQLFFWILCALVLVAAWKIFTEAYDEIEIVYDPATGRQGIKARKNRTLGRAIPLVLEGE